MRARCSIYFGTAPNRGHKNGGAILTWWPRRDLNARPTALEADALPTMQLHHRILFIQKRYCASRLAIRPIG